jgi:integrase
VGRIAAKPLTAKQVENESRLGYHADGANTGLYLQVAEGKSRINRSWVFRYTSPTTRTRRELGFGSTRVRSLADARKVAADFRLQVLEGHDPIDERERKRTTAVTARAHRVTFDEAVNKCLEAKSLEWRNLKHSQQWRNTLNTYASPVLGKIAVDLITVGLVYQVLEPIWTTKTETATRVRQRIEVILDWCKARGYTTGENPARLKGGLGELLPKAQKIKKVEHHPAVPYLEIHSFVKKLRSLGGTAALGLEFALLTATRTGEVIGARWAEFDLADKVWTVPAERMKAGREHRIPLSVRAQEILQMMKSSQQNEFVFPGHSIAKNPHLSNGAFLSVMKRMGQYSQYTPHGLRSSFRDWASETTQFPNETLELAMSHTIKNKAEAAYRRQDRLEQRSKLMQMWQDYVEADPSGKILAIRTKSNHG